MARQTQAISYKNVRQLRELLRSRELSATLLTQKTLAYIREMDELLGTCITLTDDLALAQATLADERIRGDGAPPDALTGIPILVKDAIVVADVQATAASRILDGYVSPYDATVVRKIRDMGMIMVGKANLDEFAMGSSNENSAYGSVRNPWDLSRVPGGSSGGSAAAVATGMVPLALGSDTGGSIRQPAAFCGVTGFKPSYGLVSRYGLIAFASSFDQIGPIARNVEDCAQLLSVIAGKDPLDASSVDSPTADFTATLEQGCAGIKIGIPQEYMALPMDSGVEEAFNVALEELAALGCELREVSLPSVKYMLSLYHIIAPSEASANLARFDGIKYGHSQPADGGAREVSLATRMSGFGDEVKRRIFTGGYSLASSNYSSYYMHSQRLRQQVTSEVNALFRTVDLLVTPTALTTAFKLNANVTDPLKMHANDLCTTLANLAQLPAISVPCGLSDQLPVGLQLIAPRLQDELVLRTAYAYQEAADWDNLRPAMRDSDG